jgi:transposase-like protein
MSVLSSPHFHDEAKAFEYLESIVWAGGVVCPHCGVIGGRVYDLSGVRTKASKKNPEGKVRYGLKKCGECRAQFTAKVGTVFEHARLPLTKMLQAVHLIVSSKKGISAHQLSRVLECQYKSAWFLAHRIREAMRSGDLATPFGSGGTAVEVDETYIGYKRDAVRLALVTPTRTPFWRWLTARPALAAGSTSSARAPIKSTRSFSPTSAGKLV